MKIKAENGRFVIEPDTHTEQALLLDLAARARPVKISKSDAHQASDSHQPSRTHSKAS